MAPLKAAADGTRAADPPQEAAVLLSQGGRNCGFNVYGAGCFDYSEGFHKLEAAPAEGARIMQGGGYNMDS